MLAFSSVDEVAGVVVDRVDEEVEDGDGEGEEETTVAALVAGRISLPFVAAELGGNTPERRARRRGIEYCSVRPRSESVGQVRRMRRKCFWRV